MARHFRTIAEALMSDHPPSLMAVLSAWPNVSLSKRSNVDAIKVTPKQQAEAVDGKLAAAL